jgi:hypothetical protein
MQAHHQKEVRRRQNAAAELEAARLAAAPPLSFDEILAGLKRSGVPVYDAREKT